MGRYNTIGDYQDDMVKRCEAGEALDVTLNELCWIKRAVKARRLLIRAGLDSCWCPSAQCGALCKEITEFLK